MKGMAISSPLTYYLLGPVLVLFICTSICAAEEAKPSDSTPLTIPLDCKPFHLRSMKFLLKNFNKCSRELKANSTTDKDYEENIGCALKCTMRNTGYSEDDLVTEDSMRRSVSKLVPDILVPHIMYNLMKNCHEKYGDKLDPEEAHCKTYSEYAFCIQNAIADMLDSELCIKEEKKSPKN